MSHRNRFACPAFLLLIAGAASAQLTYISYPVGGKDYETTVTQEMLKQAPQWPPESEHPPLSPRRALKLAEEYARENFKPHKDWVRELEAISLTPYADGWFWDVSYAWSPKPPVGLGGLQPFSHVFVLMDGTVIPPDKQAEDLQNEPSADDVE
jgi:hypothetical protein